MKRGVNADEHLSQVPAAHHATQTTGQQRYRTDVPEPGMQIRGGIQTVNRRAFIGALFGAAAIPADPQETAPPAIMPGKWWQHYTYCFAEVRGGKTHTMELAVERNFWMTHIQWTMPEGTRVAVRQGSQLLFEMAMPAIFTGAFSGFPVMPDLFVEAGTSLSVDFRNPEGQFLTQPAMLVMHGRREMTLEEIASWQRTAEDDEDEYDDEDDSK